MAQGDKATDEIRVSRDPRSGDSIVSQAPGGWDEIYAAR